MGLMLPIEGPAAGLKGPQVRTIRQCFPKIKDAVELSKVKSQQVNVHLLIFCKIVGIG